TALPHPGSEDQLMRLAARIVSQQLDRSKPLWELWMVEGLENNRVALISKTHHAMIDGISGIDLATVMFDLTPVPTDVDHPAEAWQPRPARTSADLVASGIMGLARTGLGLAARAASLVSAPSHAVSEAKVAAEGLG